MTEPTQADRERAKSYFKWWENAHCEHHPEGDICSKCETEKLASELAAVRTEAYQQGIKEAINVDNQDAYEQGANEMVERCVEIFQKQLANVKDSMTRLPEHLPMWANLRIKQEYLTYIIEKVSALSTDLNWRKNLTAEARREGEIAEHHRTCDGGKMCPRCDELGTVYRGVGG